MIKQVKLLQTFYDQASKVIGNILFIKQVTKNIIGNILWPSK